MEQYILIDGSSLSVKKVESNEDIGLELMYKEIECARVDVAQLTDEIDLWVDDEGLMKSGTKAWRLDYKGNMVELAGKILVSSRDNEGSSIGLSDEQVEDIKNNLTVKPIGIVK